MKSRLLLASFALFALAAARAAEKSRTIEAVAVAERFGAAAAADASTAQPPRYVALASGFWEAGEPYAGEKPPSPAAVAIELRAALASRGFEPASAADTPGILLTYHWGVMTGAALRRPTQFGLDQRGRARLALVAPLKLVREVEHDVVLSTRALAGVDYIEAHGHQQTWEQAADPRYFVIVSAYDYAAFAHGRAEALWRVKLSARMNAGNARRVIPALARGSAAYFAAAFEQPQSPTIPAPDPEVAASDNEADPLAAPAALLRVFKPGSVTQLLRREYAQFSGEPFSTAPTFLAEQNLPAADTAATEPASDRPTFAVSLYSRVTAIGARQTPPQPDQPVRYVAYDAGFNELGTPLSASEPPSAALMARMLRDALRSRGYAPAANGETPALALIYHWGYVRTAKARGAALPISNADISVTPFVIVSAYDFVDLTRNEKTLLWRVGLSAEHENLREALPALVETGAPYFGRDISKRQKLNVPIFAGEDDAPETLASTSLDAAARALIEQERMHLVWKLDLPVTPQDHLAHQPLAAPPADAAAPLPEAAWKPDSGAKPLTITAYAGQTYRGSLLTRPTPDDPVYYIAREAGAAEPSASPQTSSAPDLVASALASALAREGYQPADAQHRPTLLLVYRAEPSNSTLLAAGLPSETAPPGLLFVLSAYDYGDFSRGEKTLLWRTLLHDPAKNNPGALAALVLGGARWFGRSSDQKQELRAPLVSIDSAALTASPFLIPSEFASEFSTPFFRDLIAWERNSGYAPLLAERFAGAVRETLIQPAEDQSPALPPELTRRIAAYLKEKSAVQDAIAAQVRAQPAGADPARTVDAFTKANAARIAELLRERDAIRSELGRFVSQHGQATGNAALDAILRAFAADVQQLNTAPRSDG